MTEQMAIIEEANEIVKGRMYATKALIECQKELEQYRAIGTVEELNKYLMAKTKLEELSGHTVDVTKLIHHFCETIFEGEKHEGFCILTNEDAKMWEGYQSLGTVEELQALKEKSVAKKPILMQLAEHEVMCPSCGVKFYKGVPKYCHYCGQKFGELDWE